MNTVDEHNTRSRDADELNGKLDALPSSSGVYQFRDRGNKIIYVGKAKNLRNRVRSYFQEGGSTDPKRDMLVSKIRDFDIVVTDSEVEALLLENNLIKEHSPRYNIRLKDDKSYPYIVVTNEPYPRVFPTRIIRRDGSRYYGPYTDVRAMKLVLRTIRSIFTIRSCDYRIDVATIAGKKIKLCLDYHIKKCLGPCEGLIGEEDYKDTIRQIEQLLKGKTRILQLSLEKQMQNHAELLEFEKAADLRNRIVALQTYRDKQKVATSDFADRDIIASAHSGNDAVGIVFRVRDGKIVGKQHFVFAGTEYETADQILEHLVHRYYTKTLDIPPEVMLPIDLENSDTLGEWLKQKSGMNIHFSVPKIGDKAKLIRMCAANARFVLDEILMQRLKTDEFIPKSVQALQQDLHLDALPRRIECFDISHFQGSETVASMVFFLDGKARKSEYRKFKIESVEGVDDFAAMREVVGRRYRRLQEEKAEMPDLIVIDGGKGQLSAAVEVLQEMNLSSRKVIGLAKRLEEVFVPGQSLPQNIAKTSPGLKLLQRIRDEAHRFAVTFHRARRSKVTLRTELEEVDGVGPKRATELLQKFGSVQGVQNTSREDLADVIGWSAARSVFTYFHEDDTEIDES